MFAIFSMFLTLIKKHEDFEKSLAAQEDKIKVRHSMSRLHGTGFSSLERLSCVCYA